jgi:hypothetical protein
MGAKIKNRVLAVLALLVGLAPIVCIGVACIGFALGGGAQHQHTQWLASITLAVLVVVFTTLGGALVLTARDPS